MFSYSIAGGVDLRFQGIELHNIYNRLFTDKDGAFHDYAAAATRRRLFEKGLDIPCIDTVCNASEGATHRAVEEGKLVYLNVPDVQLDIWQQLIYHKNKWISRSLRAFIDYVTENEFGR